MGGTATGKTHLATAPGVSGIQHYSKRVRFYATVELVNTPEQEKAAGKQGRLALSLMQMDLVILDELGYVPFSRLAAHCYSICSQSSTNEPASLSRPI